MTEKRKSHPSQPQTRAEIDASGGWQVCLIIP